MSIEQRVKMCRLLEKMKGQEAFCKRLGLEDTSVINGKQIFQKEKNYVKKG